jgi:hypothetical protein
MNRKANYRSLYRHRRRGGFLPLLGSIGAIAAPLVGKLLGGLFSRNRGEGIKHRRQRPRRNRKH